MNRALNEQLIAPCGMNCGICSTYLAYAHDLRGKGIKATYCTGCIARDKKCAFVKKRCDLLMNNEVRFCYECGGFPCDRLQKLDRGYRTKYNMSMLDNLEFIRDNGVDAFIAQQEAKYKCPKCGGVICVHDKKCYNCQHIGNWKG